MWTADNRPRYNRDKLRYPSDLTDAEWAHIEPLIPPGKPRGGKRRVARVTAMNSSLDLLADFTLDVWLVAHFAPQLSGTAPAGRAWERTVAGLLYRPGFTRRQGPGNNSLFGSVSASGVRHEIDGAADGWRGSFIVECKATGGGISKADAALFHFKVMDFYQRKIATASAERWWRIMCGTTPTTDTARAAAVSLARISQTT